MILPDGTAFSDKAFRFIVNAEGVDQPWHWSGVDSGVTLPIGYDLGYKRLAGFRADWSKHLPPEVLARLSTAIGVRGRAAAALVKKFSDIHFDNGQPIPAGAIRVSMQGANEIFAWRTLPRFVAETEAVFPGARRLPENAFGGLVSLVFNRGGKLFGARRREMRDIVAYVQRGDLAAIAGAIRSMKRLWPNNPGLRRRREDEAVLVETAR